MLRATFFPREKLCIFFGQKLGRATFWAICSQTHMATLCTFFISNRQFSSRQASYLSMAWNQGDQTSLWKIAQNVAQPILFENYWRNLTMDKEAQNAWCFCNFQVTVQNKNNHQLGENSSNLVTLLALISSVTRGFYCALWKKHFWWCHIPFINLSGRDSLMSIFN
jgi:hypothetical protein